MKTLYLLLILFVISAVFAGAATTISWVRVNTTNIDEYRDLVSDSSLDIASARTGKYVDLIIGDTELAKLSAAGYSYEYLMYDVYDEANYKGKGYSGYTNYTEMQTRLDALVTNYPNILSRSNEGTGRQGTHDIYLIKISDNVATADISEPDLMITGVHHAREPMSLEVPLYFIEQICANYGTDPDVTAIVDELELYVIPLLNPEGYNYDDIESERNMWRKNSYDWPSSSGPDDWGGGWGTGVDPNRNYSYQWGNGTSWYEATYCGDPALSEPENQIVADLAVANAASDNDFISAMSFHSYSELILRPWGYTSSDPPSDDLAIMDDIGEGYHDVILAETGRNYEYKASNGLYPTNGDFVDYMYGEHGCIPFTIELNSSGQGGFYPDESHIGPTTQGHYEALKWWCGYIIENYTGGTGSENDGVPTSPTAFTLSSAVPNPASDNVTFAFTLPESTNINLEIYDISGRKVKTVVNGEFSGGDNEVTTDISALSNGVYLYKLSSDASSSTKKLIIK